MTVCSDRLRRRHRRRTTGVFGDNEREKRRVGSDFDVNAALILNAPTLLTSSPAVAAPVSSAGAALVRKKKPTKNCDVVFILVLLPSHPDLQLQHFQKFARVSRGRQTLECSIKLISKYAVPLYNRQADNRDNK